MKDLQTIISKCRSKDIRAEYELYRKCFDLLMGICNRYTVNKDDAVDLLNRAFLKIINNLDKYDINKPFDKWAKSITVNTIIDEFRKNKNHKGLFSEQDISETFVVSEHFYTNDGLERLEAQDLLKEIRKLPDGCKEVFNLYVFEGLNHHEIAKNLHIAESTSRWHLANARNILKSRFAKLVGSLKGAML